MSLEKGNTVMQSEDFSLYLFDMGNVVVKNISTLEGISQQYGIPLEELRIDYAHYEFPLMDGTIDSSLYWRHVEHQFGISIVGDPLVDFFRPTWNEPIVQLITKLKEQDKRVVCGSNTYAPHWDYLEAQGFLSLFDKTYASHTMGISKPSAQFFLHILKQEQVMPQKVFFLDDYEENIVASKRLGIVSYLYRGTKEEEDQLPKILGL